MQWTKQNICKSHLLNLFSFSLCHCDVYEDGPYGLTINNAKGQKVGKVFTLDKGDAVQLYCSADSNPPNIYSWILKANNSIHPVQYGEFLEIASEEVTQRTEYICTAYNNMTETHVETHILVIVIPKGKNDE